MLKGLAKNLMKLNSAEFKTWLSTFDTVISDCDGVLWVYNDIIEGSPDVINKFKEIGKKVFFITNNSTKTQKEYYEKSKKLGFNMLQEEIIGTAYVVASYLKEINFNKKVFIIGSSAIGKELEAVGIEHFGIGPDVLDIEFHEYMKTKLKFEENVGAVVVGFDEHLSFPKMIKAATYLKNPDCLFIATNTDPKFPTNNCILPGTGGIVSGIETSSERKAHVMGKPNPDICKSLIASGKIVPERTLMIGDRCDTDILLGKNCGFQTLLVESGIHKYSDVEIWMKNGTDEDKLKIPDFYLPTLGSLFHLM